MPTKVYLSGKNIIIDQVTQPLLTIRTDRALYNILTPFYSDGTSTPQASHIEFKDVHYLTLRTERITEVQDGAGTPFADFFALQAYLNGFFQRATGTTIVESPCCGDAGELTTISKAVDYSALVGDYVVVTTALIDVTITFPSDPDKDELIGVFFYSDGGGNVIIDGNGNNLNGLATVTMTTVQESLIWQYNGAEWLLR